MPAPPPPVSLAAWTAAILCAQPCAGCGRRAVRTSSVEKPGMRMLYWRSRTIRMSRVSSVALPRSLASLQAAATRSSTKSSAIWRKTCGEKCQWLVWKSIEDRETGECGGWKSDLFGFGSQAVIVVALTCGAAHFADELVELLLGEEAAIFR